MGAQRDHEIKDARESPDPECGQPGGGRGRTDRVGHTGVYPGSGPWPPGEVEARTPDTFVKGQRDEEGREVVGGSEPIYFNRESLLGGVTPIQSLVTSGSKVWLDSVDPDEVARNRAWGITGATSNPIIVADLIETGRLDAKLNQFFREGLDDYEVAWRMTDLLVRRAQEVFLPVWEATRGEDGYVSFELDPLLEDPERRGSEAGREPQRLDPEQTTRRYIELGKRWSAGHRNRMIKVPATPSGLAALEELAAAGVTVNVTLTFTPRQYVAARDALWRGARRRRSLDAFKSVYSIFVSRVDVYTEKHLPGLSSQAQGQVGIVNAKRIWRMNQEFWADKRLPMAQEIIFASTGVKKADDPPWKYVEAFAGSGIETNPPATNAKVQASGRTFPRAVDRMPPDDVLAEIDAKVDMEHLEATLMAEGLKKFAAPQKELLDLIARKRRG
jgi:transaldolase